MNISDYIESGIIERYVLGLTSPDQEEELLHLRLIYPLLDIEITAAELRIEDKLQEEGQVPPDELRTLVLQRFRTEKRKEEQGWRNYNTYEPTNRRNTYIHLEPFWNRRITVSIWWRCGFIAMVVLTMSLAASTWYFHQRTQQLEEVLIELKVAAITHSTDITH